MKKKSEMDWEERRDWILAAYSEIGTIKGTSKKLRVSVNTVRKVLRCQDGPRVAPRTKATMPSKLDPYRAIIRRLVLEENLTGTLVLEEIRALGYPGGHAILQGYIRKLRPSQKRTVTTVVPHPPGDEGQVDWSPYRVTLTGETRVVHAFSMVLPFSRYMVLRFAFDEKMETLIAMHEDAFSELGGVLRLMSYDNMTTVGRHVSKDKVKLSERFAHYARECGFDIHLIDPGRPNQHASVERHFHYVENNFLKRHRFRFGDLSDLNRKAKEWCDNVANVRVHGTTRERPVDRLMRERPYFLPLPGNRPETYRLLSRKVGTDFCVAVDTNRYSVPPTHVQDVATVRLYGNRLEILIGGNLVAVHLPCEERHKRLVLPEHEEAFKRCTPSRVLLEQAFLRLGHGAEDYYQGLLTQRGKGAGYHLQRILKMADRHGSAVVTGAMTYTARYGNYSADAVARVIAGRELRPASGPADSPEPPERVRRWLEGIDVETADLDAYDRIVDSHAEEDSDD
jgi:transposase